MTEKDLDALMEAVSSRLTKQKRTYFTDDVRRRLQGVLDDLDPRLVIRQVKTPHVLFHAVLRGAERKIFGLYAHAKHCRLEIIGLAGYSPDGFFYRELRAQRPDLYECFVPYNEGRRSRQQPRIAVYLTSPADADSRVAAFQQAVGLFLDSLRSASTTVRRLGYTQVAEFDAAADDWLRGRSDALSVAVLARVTTEGQRQKLAEVLGISDSQPRHRRYGPSISTTLQSLSAEKPSSIG